MRCWTQSATASESKVNSTHSHTHYVLFLTLEVSPPHCFSKWPACYFPTKPSVNKLHSSAQWSFLTSSPTEAAKYKGSQGDQQFHLIEVSIFIYLQMVIMIIIVIVIVLGLSYNDWNNSQQLCSKLQIFLFIFKIELWRVLDVMNIKWLWCERNQVAGREYWELADCGEKAAIQDHLWGVGGGTSDLLPHQSHPC